MKKITLLFIFIYISFFINITVNAISVPALWSLNWTNWKVVFPNSTDWVYVVTDSFVLNNSADMQIKWNFWLQNLSSLSDASLWWATFDIWTIPSAPKVILKNNLDNTFTFSWYAWSKAAWWIYFSPTLLKNSSGFDIPNSKVIYDRWFSDWKWVINGCAWSQNIWFICFDGISLDTTPPHLFGTINSLSMVTSANHNKVITLNESSTWTIEYRYSSALKNFTTDSSFKFTHDMRYSSNPSREYHINATDIYGNSTSWIIKIVAGLPIWIDNSHKIYSWADWLSYNWTLWEDKIADWNDKHKIDIKLRDTYWNPIVTVPGIKNVALTLWFSNNLDKNQISNYDIWDAINFVNSDFLLFWGIWNIEDTISTSDWNYSVDITSLTPSKEGYLYASQNNDIKVNKLNLNITALNWNSWIWEWNFNDLHNSYYPTPYKFIPTVKVDWISNSDDFVITRDNDTNFTITWTINKTIWSNTLSNIKITHLFDIMSWSIYKNNYMNFQNLSWTTSWISTTCIWYKSSLVSYNSTSVDCNRSSPNSSSNIIRNYWNKDAESSTFNDTINLLPRVIQAWLSKFDTKYSSIISYNINWEDVRYPSYWTNSSIINSQIIVAWIVNKNNKNFSVTDDSTINYIWDISKLEVYNRIYKNISLYQKIWTGTTNILYKKWDYNLSNWPAWIDTIIIDSWDIIISNNISKILWKVKTIIALKKQDWTKWNIWIKNNVQFIWATLITNKSVISWDWTIYYSDTNNAKDQLFIKWNVLSYNSIWGASNSPIICPYYIDKTLCNLQTAKKYDLNHFRTYINWVRWSAFDWTSYWVSMYVKWYVNATMIIEYDSDIQRNPPSILKK